MKWEQWSTTMDCYIITRVVCCRVDGRRRRQPPTPNFQPKVVQDSNLDFRIELDPEVCRICPKVLWMHYLAGISHFAKYGTNRSSIVWEMVTDVQKSPVPQWWRKWKSDTEFARRSWSPPLVRVCQIWSTSVSTFVSNPVYRMTERSHNLRLKNDPSNHSAPKLSKYL